MEYSISLYGVNGQQLGREHGRFHYLYWGSTSCGDMSYRVGNPYLTQHVGETPSKHDINTHASMLRKHFSPGHFKALFPRSKAAVPLLRPR